MYAYYPIHTMLKGITPSWFVFNTFLILQYLVTIFTKINIYELFYFQFHTPLSQNTVESMVFSIVQTEGDILQLSWTSVNWQLQYVYLGTQRPGEVTATRTIDKVIPLSLTEATWLATISVWIPSWCRKWWATISVGNSILV